MDCKYFGKCGSCVVYNISCNEQISRKKNKIKDQFSEFYTEDIEVFTSKDAYFRNRAEFRIWHNEDKISYAMNGFNKKDIVLINNCFIVEKKIFTLMPKILSFLQNNLILKEKLFTIEFLSAEDIMVTLIYHKKLSNTWRDEAKKLEKELAILVIGRSRGEKIVLSDDFIFQELNILDTRYKYKIYENSFLQPNTKVNEKMISWVKINSKNFKNDLLELYCGHGNFTIPLSNNFKKVLATEISKKSIKAAKENCLLNDIKNITFVRLSDKELVSALKNERIFKRLEGVKLKEYDFSTIFVDPPRAGIDKESIKFISNFNNIIYISCNPETLKRDISKLFETHSIKKFAIFDQFVYTNHLECGIILKKRIRDGV